MATKPKFPFGGKETPSKEKAEAKFPKGKYVAGEKAEGEKNPKLPFNFGKSKPADKKAKC